MTSIVHLGSGLKSFIVKFSKLYPVCGQVLNILPYISQTYFQGGEPTSRPHANNG